MVINGQEDAVGDERTGFLQSDDKAPDESLRIGFAHLETIEPDSLFIGGIFVTDGTLRPVEFRCTSPIRPTQVQRILYGAELVPVMAQELVLENCLKKLQNKVNLILCDSKEFLGARTRIGTPLLALEKGTDIGSAASSGASKTATLSSEEGRFESLLIHTHHLFTDDHTQWLPQLRKVFSSRDLMEPFKRQSRALKEVYSSKYKGA